MAIIHNLEPLEYNISDLKSEDGKKIKDLLNDIKQNSLQDSLSHFIESEEFVFELKNTTVSIQPNSNPSFFSIPINRTQYVDDQAIKNDKAITFNDTFTISEQNFKLTDIIMHGGEGSESGHYYTISKREIELTNGQKHIVFLQHSDAETQCFMKFGNEIQFIDIKDVESLVESYEFATLADIKESQKIEQNFTNIIYQKEIPSSKIDNTYKGLENYGNSCYINSFLAVVAGMNDGSEKQLLLTQLKANGIELLGNKFSGPNLKNAINRIRLEELQELDNDCPPLFNLGDEDTNQINEIKVQPPKESFKRQTSNEIKSIIPATVIQPPYLTKKCNFFANQFSCCKGN